MKRFTCIALLLMLLLSVATASAATIEPVQQQRIYKGLVLVDYGFAIEKSSGRIKYGCRLDNTEAQEGEGYTPLMYFSIKNDGDTAEIINLYVRGGSKYNWFWNWKSEYIGPGETMDYYAYGYETLAGFSGAWSVSVNSKYVVRFALAK